MADNEAEFLEKEHPDLKAMEPIQNTQVAPGHGIAAMALSFALRYHDINTVQDGALYQQYKLEGRNMTDLRLEHVFETAIRMERHILGGSERVAQIVAQALIDSAEEEGLIEGEQDPDENGTGDIEGAAQEATEDQNQKV